MDGAVQDPDKLLVLVQEINRLLEEKEQRLSAQRDAVSKNTKSGLQVISAFCGGSGGTTSLRVRSVGCSSWGVGELVTAQNGTDKPLALKDRVYGSQ